MKWKIKLVKMFANLLLCLTSVQFLIIGEELLCKGYQIGLLLVLSGAGLVGWFWEHKY